MAIENGETRERLISGNKISEMTDAPEKENKATELLDRIERNGNPESKVQKNV